MVWAPRGLKDGGVETCTSTFKLLCFISLSSALALISQRLGGKMLIGQGIWPSELLQSDMQYELDCSAAEKEFLD